MLGRVHKVFNAIPSIAGEKVKYTNISRDDRSGELKQAINLLTRARLLLPAYHSHCSGIPIKSGIVDKHYKLFFLDVGLLNYSYGLDWAHIAALDERTLLNEGVLAEQFVAQHMAYQHQGLEPPELFYWLREGRAANAEVDFVTSTGTTIVPIEVKAGASGSMKSIQQFALEKQSPLTCRIDLNPPSVQRVSHQTRQKHEITPASYQLLSLPLYLVESLPKILSAQLM